MNRKKAKKIMMSEVPLLPKEVRGDVLRGIREYRGIGFVGRREYPSHPTADWHFSVNNGKRPAEDNMEFGVETRTYTVWGLNLLQASYLSRRINAGGKKAKTVGRNRQQKEEEL